MLQRRAAAALQPPVPSRALRRAAPASTPRQPRRTRAPHATEQRVEPPARSAWAVAPAPLRLACAGFACALLLNARSATAAAAEAAGLVSRSAARDETERVLAEELAQSFRRLPEDEQVALVERLLRRAIASDASRGGRAELPPAATPRPRAEAESGAAELPSPRGSTPLLPPAPAPGRAAVSGAEPTSELDAQDGWGDAAQLDAPPLALELEKLLPSAQSRPPLAAAPPLSPPAAGAGPRISPAASREQAAFDALLSADAPVEPLAVAAAAGAAFVLGAAAVWLSRSREVDAAQPQAAPKGDSPRPPPDAAVSAAAPEALDAAASTRPRRPGVLWARKEKAGAEEPAADAAAAAPSVLWTRGARQVKPDATEDAPPAAGNAAEPENAAELSDNAEGLRFGARLTRGPQSDEV